MNPAPPAPLELVEWRVDGKPAERRDGFVSRFVPYLDAAAVGSLLDQWVGPNNWRDAYEPGQIDGTFVLWCHLAVRDPEFPTEWVTKSDVGRPSNFEGQKGCVSDAFKRAACLKWGAGRNVYELPTLWAPCRTFTTKNGVQAAPNDQTLPEILRQLKALGYDVNGGRVQQEPPDGVDTETGEVEPIRPNPGKPSEKGSNTAPVCGACGGPIDGPVKKVEGVWVHKECP